MWAEPDTLLGLLQRGRGRCRQEAASQPLVAADLLVECIIHEPRWDRQLEERSWLYAALAVDLDLDPTRLRAAYAGPVDPTGDADAWLAVGVLGHLARRGVDEAVDELRRYLRTGRDLDLALGELIPVADHPAAQGLLDDVLAVADDEQLRDSLGMDRHARASVPQRWAAHPRIDRALAAGEAVRASWAEHRPVRAITDREAVLRAAAESKIIAPTSVAEVTEKQWETTLLAIVTDKRRRVATSWTARDRFSLRRELTTSESPAVLAWARSFSDHEDYLAFSILTDLATPSDAPRLYNLLLDSRTRGDHGISEQYRLVQALGRVGYHAAVDTIENLYDTTVYAGLRRRCAAALSGLSDDFAGARAVECLDDCESETRGIAIARVDPRDDEIRARLLRIAEDVTEEDDNRRRAAARLSLTR